MKQTSISPRFGNHVVIKNASGAKATTKAFCKLAREEGVESFSGKVLLASCSTSRQEQVFNVFAQEKELPHFTFECGANTVPNAVDALKKANEIWG